MPLLKNPLEQYYLVQGGFKRTDLNDTESDSTTLVASRYWDLSSGWQRAINLRWSLDHFTQGEITNTTMLFYPGVMISRTRSRGGLMPTWGDSQRYSIDYSNTAWGSDVDFSVFQAQNVWIRTLYDRHRFVARGTLGWIETGDFDKVPPDLRFFAGGDRSIRGYKYKSIAPKYANGDLKGASKLITGSLEYQYNVTGKWWGAFLLAEHLPEDQTQRDKILMAIMGSGNDLEIDGIGGGNPLTSKVAIISRSSDPRADVDYLFAQVIVHEQRVDTTPNCGNMLSGVGAFAIENGLIAATSPVTRVRIRNVNTGTFIEADVQTPNGVVEYEGSARIDGVPGTAAPVALTFLNAAGTKTGKVFPTDNQIDYFDDVPVTCIDMAMPVVIIPAEYLGKTGYELPAELDADKALYSWNCRFQD